MSAPRSTLGHSLARRLSTAAVVLVLGVPAGSLLAGCGVNFNAQTDQPYQPAAGVDDRTGAVDVLNALLVSGTNGSGTFVAQLVNNNQTRQDTLEGVAGAGQDTAVKVTQSGTTSIPGGGAVNLATASSQWSATGQRIQPGNFVRLTLSFDHGGPVTVDVPVVSASDPQYAQVKLPAGSGTASGSASPSTSPSASPSTSPSNLSTSGATPSAAESPS